MTIVGGLISSRLATNSHGLSPGCPFSAGSDTCLPRPSLPPHSSVVTCSVHLPPAAGEHSGAGLGLPPWVGVSMAWQCKGTDAVGVPMLTVTSGVQPEVAGNQRLLGIRSHTHRSWEEVSGSDPKCPLSLGSGFLASLSQVPPPPGCRRCPCLQQPNVLRS